MNEDYVNMSLRIEKSMGMRTSKKVIFARALSAFAVAFFAEKATAAPFAGSLQTVTVSDAAGVNAPPAVVFSYTQNGSVFTFDASGTSDPDGNIAQYSWDFGDGTTGTGNPVQHQFGIQGATAKITLTATDNQGAVGIAQTSFLVALPTVYEDAEDGTIARWVISDNDPIGAVITNTFDDTRQSRVIQLQGTRNDASNAYKLTQASGATWNNTQQFIAQWSFKYSYPYEVFWRCTTSAGTRDLKYTPAATNTLGTSGIVHHGLGTTTLNGQWQTITRDLRQDLAEAQPGVQILSVQSFTIRGNGRVDDIMLK